GGVASSPRETGLGDEPARDGSCNILMSRVATQHKVRYEGTSFGGRLALRGNAAEEHAPGRCSARAHLHTSVRTTEEETASCQAASGFIVLCSYRIAE
ncbi:MAG: hypothetical protein ACR2NM_03000, partial [Bythopirellula sp.]